MAMGKFKAELIARSVFVLFALVFLSANMATDKHLAHSAGAKLITFDHQVRRDLSRAERENLRTSVLSCKGEVGLTPLLGVVGIARPPEFVLNSYATPRPLIQLGPKTIALELSPILNL